MAVKYECPECGRRFLEWGAEKSGFKCPNDDHCPDGHPEDTELTAITFEQDQPIRRKPTLKRTAAAAKRRRAAAKVDTAKVDTKEASPKKETTKKGKDTASKKNAAGKKKTAGKKNAAGKT